jgi:hypothetical protein
MAPVDEQSWLDAWNSQSAVPIIEFCDPEVEVHAVTLGIEGRSYKGHDGVREWMRDIRDRFGARSETRSIEPLADNAVLLNGAVFVTDDYGREEEQRVAMVVHLKDGKARWVGTFFSATDARSAFESGVTGPSPG